jgi:magnesium transporter
MIKRFQLNSGALAPTDSEGGSIQLYVNPDARERKSLLANYSIDDHSLSSALDPDEVARFEPSADHMLLIWKRPTNYSADDTFCFDVASVGLLVRKDRLVLIAKDDIQLIDAQARHSQSLHSPLDVMLALLLSIIHHYLEHLKLIKRVAHELEEKINTSLENKHLIQMFNLSESLIYYINAINSNGAVLTRLRNHADQQGLSAEAAAFIDDLIIENDQCYKQAEIYSTVFSGLMDARGSIVNNNMNMLLRNLTIINVVFLPLNLIASIGGMSEFSMMTRGIDWRISYLIFCAAILLIGWLTAILLRKVNFGGNSVNALKWWRKREAGKKKT